MKGVKGKFLKKFKAIQTIGTLKQGPVFHHQLNPTSEKLSNLLNPQTPPPLLHREQDLKNDSSLLSDQLLGSIGLSKRFKDLNYEDMESEFNVCENAKQSVSPPIDNSSADPILSEDHNSHQEAKVDDDDEIEIHPSLSDFEEKCPPGGNTAIILYTTSLRGIRKTFEECHAIRFLLESFRIVFHERDVSMHLDFREELWKILGGRVIPPRLFVKGRYIGGADEVVGLHEQGKLKKLLEGIPIHLSNSTCTGCANMRFLVCFNCNGSRRVFKDGESNNDDLYIRCLDCNENGLVKCPICS